MTLRDSESAKRAGRALAQDASNASATWELEGLIIRAGEHVHVVERHRAARRGLLVICSNETNLGPVLVEVRKLAATLEARHDGD
jgi:hypothetical protein